MKKILLSVAVGSALGLTGCLADGDDAPEYERVSGDQRDTSVRERPVRVQFEPSDSIIPIPSDILFSGSTDGTLSLPVDDADNFADPQVAISALDGWSTTQPMTFDFSYPLGADGERVSLNSESVESREAVRVFKMASCDAPSISQGTANCSVERELDYGDHFVVKYTGQSIAVIPTLPLQQSTTYVVALTEGIKDEFGRGIRPSQTYSVLRQPSVELGEDAAGLQRLIQTYESALHDYGLSPSRYALASGFTTQSVDNVLQTVQGLMSVGQLPVGPVMAQNQEVTVGQALIAQGAIEVDSQAAQVGDSALLFDGQFTAPYFSGVPTEESPAAPRESFWQAEFISVASILAAVGSGAVEFEDLIPLMERAQELDFPEDPQSLAGQIPFAVAAADENGAGGVLASLDGNRNLTKFNPIPAVRSLENIPFVMSVPDIGVVNGIRESMQMESISEPEDGWPVVIFQHGIGGNKEQALAIAGTLALNGQAMIAIDHPLHGERDFGSDQFNAGVDPTAYLNLSSLLTARDNLRQSVSDLLALRYAIGNPDSMFGGVNIDGDSVKFVGHSLGAIVGNNFVSIANSPHRFSEEAQQLGVSFDLEVAALGMPGGGIASFLLESEQFRSVIGGLLSYQQIEPFRQAADQAIENDGGPALGTPAFNEFIAEFYVQFFDEAPAALVAGRDELLTQFRFAAQTVIDSADPINYAALARSTETPMMLIQADGDSVIPNTTEFPTAGTEPLAQLLGLPVVTSSKMGEDRPLSGYLRYSDATHASLLSPGDNEVGARVTQSMQTSVGVYMFSNGAALVVDEDELR